MIDRMLHLVFAALLAVRFSYPFVSPPQDHMLGLSGRQWKQAGNFWSPDPMGGVDGFLYQAWLAGVRWLSQDVAWIVNSASGLLCAAVPLCWWLCAREFLPRRSALLFAICVAIIPSFFSIYSYFASETLLLPLMGLACWQSALCWKHRSYRVFIFTALLWGLAACTRTVALPPAIACLCLLWWRVRFSWAALAGAIICLSVVWGMAAHYAYRAIGVYTPFGMPQMNAVLARSEASKLYIYFNGDRHWFRSPSFAARPLAPLSDWRISSLKEPVHIHITTALGRESWQEAMEVYPVEVEWLLRQIHRNVIFVLFGESWPETLPQDWPPDASQNQWEDNINQWARLIWAPLIVLVVAMGWRVQSDGLPRAFITLTLLMLATLFFQTTAVMEGRYRKPVEPLVLLSAFLIWQHRQERQNHG